MPQAKVNLLSTEQMFKDKTISCAMINGNSLVLMDHQFHSILTATNRGNGAYVCTVEDLRQAFVKSKLQQSLVNWTEPSITIYYPNSPVKTTMAEISNGDENYWAMPAIFEGESLSTKQQERTKETPQ